MRRIFVISSLLLSIVATGAFAQPGADSLRKAYDFQGAVKFCETLIEKADSSRLEELESELALSQNGLSMTSYCSQPKVVAKYLFSIDDFFLFYPLKNHSWHPVPNPLDSIGRTPCRIPIKATYVPEDASTIYYSAMDGEGIRNIYRTHDQDSIWSAPELINEHLTSSSDEIFPMLSPDGKSLFFASDGLYGMGGFDLYVSEWNEEANDWNAPVNMGFPYSSPYDDFLFINTEDGKYSMFASNRECSADSVYIYVLEFDSMPVRRSVESVDELKSLSMLTPPEDVSGSTEGMSGISIQEDENVIKYKEAMARVRELRDSISAFSDKLDKMRSELTSGESDNVEELKQSILKGELELPARQAGLDQAIRVLQDIEMAFLTNGIVIDPDKLKAEADREVVGTSSSYAFSKNEMGNRLMMNVAVPEKVFDYSFKILEVGQFAEDNTLPDGLCYQIQLFSVSKEATEASLKGLSPVFMRKSSGRFIYSAGLFRTYSDVLSNLNKVKCQGFKTAMIVAFDSGKPISISKARALENQVRDYYKLRIEAPGGNLPEGTVTLIKDKCDKDISRTVDGTLTIFEVGPFSSGEECGEVAAALNAAGISGVSVSKVEPSE